MESTYFIDWLFERYFIPSRFINRLSFVIDANRSISFRPIIATNWKHCLLNFRRHFLQRIPRIARRHLNPFRFRCHAKLRHHRQHFHHQLQTSMRLHNLQPLRSWLFDPEFSIIRHDVVDNPLGLHSSSEHRNRLGRNQMHRLFCYKPFSYHQIWLVQNQVVSNSFLE